MKGQLRSVVQQAELENDQCKINAVSVLERLIEEG